MDERSSLLEDSEKGYQSVDDGEGPPRQASRVASRAGNKENQLIEFKKEGLTTEEAKSRLKQYGYNMVEEKVTPVRCHSTLTN